MISGGEIIELNLEEIDPFGNKLDSLEVKGRTLRKILEDSAKLLTPENEDDPSGWFLQVSGNSIDFYPVLKGRSNLFVCLFCSNVIGSITVP